jgi:hypothetical protein
MYVLFDNRLFQFIMLALIAFIGVFDWKVAFIVALIYAVIMHNLNQKKITEAFINGLRNEGFFDYHE